MPFSRFLSLSLATLYNQPSSRGKPNTSEPRGGGAPLAKKYAPSGSRGFGLTSSFSYAYADLCSPQGLRNDKSGRRPVLSSVGLESHTDLHSIAEWPSQVRHRSTEPTVDWDDPFPQEERIVPKQRSADGGNQRCLCTRSPNNRLNMPLIGSAFRGSGHEPPPP